MAPPHGRSTLPAYPRTQPPTRPVGVIPRVTYGRSVGPPWVTLDRGGRQQAVGDLDVDAGWVDIEAVDRAPRR
jgi:hypothetical protein